MRLSQQFLLGSQGGTMENLSGIDTVQDSMKRRFYSELVREISTNLEFSVKKSRQDHLQASIPGMPKWAHLATLFKGHYHKKDKMENIRC